MPFLQRYSGIRHGGIVLTGNTLGLSKAANSTAAGTLGSIGAFVSLDTSLQVNDFPPGTTLDYTKNGSAATLTLPAGAYVLYAELVWGGLYRSTVSDISARMNDGITLTTPLGPDTVLPAAATAQNFLITNSGVTVGFYVRTADVTAIVRQAGAGTYSAGRVPALIEALDARTSETNHAGWTLAVVYESGALPLRDLTLWSGGAVVSPSSGSTDITLTGFVTPDAAPMTGRLYVSSQEGDAGLTGDRMLFGASTAALTAVSGPNNPAGNFFASQINDSAGALDTSGTFGSRNASAAAGTNTRACRQGWDVTSVDVSALLTPGMTTAAMRFTTNGDLYVPNCLALAIDSKGALIEAVKSADRTFASVGEEIGYSVTLRNTGSIRAETVTLTDILPEGLTLSAGSVRLNGAPYAGGLPVTFGPLDAGAEATVTFSAYAAAVPAVNPVVNVATADYVFMPFPGYPVPGSSESGPVSCYITDNVRSLVKNVNKAAATVGEELLYTSVLGNAGNLRMTGIVFTDAVPAGTTFLPGSVAVNGVAQPAYDPSSGFPLPDLDPGQSAAVTFTVTINTTGEEIMIIDNNSNVTFDYVLPDGSTISGEQDSNTVSTEVLTYAVTRVKSSDKTFLGEGENARQTVVFTNNSAADLTNVSFADTMSSGATHVAGSVTVNGVSQPTYDPVAGFALPDIPSGGSATVEYSILSNNPKTDNTVTNTGALTYTVNDAVRGPVTYTENTNDVSLVLVSTRMTVIKSVDKSYAVRGDNLHYTSAITNSGSMNKTNLIFRDPAPAGTMFVPGSVRVNGTQYASYDPAVGFVLPDLAVGQTVTVEFDVTVV